MDEPLDGLAFGEIHGLSEGGGEVDVELLAGFAVDELNFGRERQGRLLRLVIQLDHNSKKIHIQEGMFGEMTSQRPNARAELARRKSLSQYTAARAAWPRSNYEAPRMCDVRTARLLVIAGADD